MIEKEMNVLQKELLSNFNWSFVRKFIFGIKGKKKGFFTT